MSDWATAAIIAIIAVYKLASHWLDSRGEGMRESDTYSVTETMPHEIRDDTERRIPDVRLGFQKEQQ
jgi:hypothetical protein